MVIGFRRDSVIDLGKNPHSPSGYGIHWPLIDEDLAAGPLLRADA